jgi:charged multivesicular body protein 6
MKTQRDKLQQYQKRITVITSRETEVARECLRCGDKRKALLALRRKKYQESLLQKTDAQLAQLEILTSDVEFALVQKDVMYGLQQGTEVLKMIHKEMGGVEGVEKLLGDSEEAKVYQKVRSGCLGLAGGEVLIVSVQEINDMLAGRISNEEEDEVEDELEALGREINGIKAPETVEQPSLPDAPGELPAARTPSQKERWERRAREQMEEHAEPLFA